MTKMTDVLVVGAGVVGASIALELSRHGGRAVTVVDKASGPGLGSTGASSAVIRFNFSTWQGVAISWESKFLWESWEDYLGYRDSSGLAKFHKTGMVSLDVPDIPRARTLDLFDRARIPYEEWNSIQLKSHLPFLDVGKFYPPKSIDSDEFFDDATAELGGIFTPDAGYVNDPQLAASNLGAAAAYNGATFIYSRQVVKLEQTNQNIWTVTLDNGDVIESPVVVNAAGPWSSALNRLADVGSDFTVTVNPMRQEVHHVAAAPQHAARDPFPIVSDMDLGIYVRPDTNGNLLIGGTEPACDPLEWIDDPDASDPRPTVGRFNTQVLRAARRLPDLSVPNRPRGISGVYDVSSDWTPIYDKTQRSGFYVAIGTSGNQFKNAPVIGPLMGNIIDGVEGGVDHDRRPIHYYTSATKHDIDLGCFSRKRPVNPDSSGTVMG